MKNWWIGNVNECSPYAVDPAAFEESTDRRNKRTIWLLSGPFKTCTFFSMEWVSGRGTICGGEARFKLIYCQNIIFL